MTDIYEVSAGGLVYRKRDGGIEILLLKWKNAKKEEVYVLPKGHIEMGENMQSTAIREISEETGLEEKKLEIVKFMNKIQYNFIASYKEGSPTINKDVYLFLVRYRGDRDPVPQKKEGFTGFGWFGVTDLDTLPLQSNIAEFVKNNILYMS